jgi:copper chaperone CopZ
MICLFYQAIQIKTTMKRIIFIAAIMMACFQVQAQIQSAQLSASGLTCSMCSKSIYKSLMQLSSVDSVAVDIDQSLFTIFFKSGVPVFPDDIKKAVTDAGFAIASLQMTANFPATDVAKDTHMQFAGATYHILNAQGQHIEGIRTFSVLDKNFVTTAVFRRNKKYTQMTCYETGHAAACCHQSVKNGDRIYHITF